MILYVGRRKATGNPVQSSFKQVLVNESGETVWACDNVIVGSEKSEAQADVWMTEFLDRLDETVDLRWGENEKEKTC